MARPRVVVSAMAAVAIIASAIAAPAGAAKRTPKEAEGSTVLEQGFTAATAEGWIIIDQGITGAREENGEVITEIREPLKGHRVFAPFSLVPPTELAVEVDATYRSGDFDKAAWGVLCRATLVDSYSLTVSSDGYFSIFRTDDTGSTRLDADDKASKRRARKAIKKDPEATNRIRGECSSDGRLRLFVNGKFVTEANDPTPLTGIAFGTYLEASEITEPVVVAFDDFELIDTTS